MLSSKFKQPPCGPELIRVKATEMVIINVAGTYLDTGFEFDEVGWIRSGHETIMGAHGVDTKPS